MDKIQFDREWYRLGHTLVFFKAGSLARLEEARDEIVLKLVRYLQGEVYKRIRFPTYAKRRDQRELIKVAQRNFRKYVSMREWGWFVIIQKTRPLIGQPNPEEELRLLEEKANATYGGYKEALDVTEGLKGEMDQLKADIASLTKTLEEEQGNLSVYTDRQAKANKMKVEAEGKLAIEQTNLTNEEASRIELAAEVKRHAGSIGVVRRTLKILSLPSPRLSRKKP